MEESYNEYEGRAEIRRLYITTRSREFPYYDCPYDFWRYEVEDMRRIFANFEIINLSAGWEAPGVFVKARKPEDYEYYNEME